MALYTVEGGDSIWTIAEKSLGMQMPGQPLDPLTIANEMQKIIGLNLAKLDNNPDLIHRGLVLDIGGSPTPGQAMQKGKDAKKSQPKQSQFPEGEGVPPGAAVQGQQSPGQPGGGGGGKNLTDLRDQRLLDQGSEPGSVPELQGGVSPSRGRQVEGKNLTDLRDQRLAAQGVAPGQVPQLRGSVTMGPGGSAVQGFTPRQGGILSGAPYPVAGNLMSERPAGRAMTPRTGWNWQMAGGYTGPAAAPVPAAPAAGPGRQQPFFASRPHTPVPGSGGLSAADVYRQGLQGR